MTLLQKPNPLPEPSSYELAHSQKLEAKILEEIDAQGAITFARYMELALYAPGLGYYSAGARKFGATGDFITAPEISPLFARCIARQCQQVLQHLGGGDILEFGAGSGILAADLLLELEKLNCLPKHYYILEISADLRERQQQLLKEKIPKFFAKIIWLDHLPEEKLQGVIIANEVLDAMPVHKFKMESGIKEYYVSAEGNNLIWHLGEPSNTILAEQIAALGLSEGYDSEINLIISNWIAGVSAILHQGLILLSDYGFLREEFYHPQRSMGTLMCHYRHHAHDNPLLYPGLQDITAHVDFTAVGEAAEKAGLVVAGYTNQANFLLNCGIAEMAVAQDAAEQYKLSNQVKKLLLPSEMGELFKVMSLTRGIQ